MKILELLNKANSVYPDSYLDFYYDITTGDPVDGKGDTLAEFIVRELQDVFEDGQCREELISESVKAMESAAATLSRVADALRTLEQS